jgi:hypothetical protein
MRSPRRRLLEPAPLRYRGRRAIPRNEQRSTTGYFNNRRFSQPVPFACAHDANFAPGGLTMPALDVEVRNLVSKDTLSETVRQLCAIGEKVSGFPAEEKACAYITGKLAEYGVSHTVHTFESYISYPRQARLIVHARDSYEIQAVGVAFGLSTAADGYTSDVVLVNAGNDADYAGKDVKGRIALITKLPTPHNALVAARHGAKGMICMSAGKQRHKMIITPVWGTPEFNQTDAIPRLHVASIAGTDGQRIVADVKSGAVRATLIADTFEGWRTVRLPVAEIKGSEPLFVLAGGHYCSWFDGSTDNGTGDACVLELARVLKPFEGKMRYGVRFAWWPGHSHGRYSGSTWYADNFWRDLYDHAIVYLNIDSPGVKGATVYVPRNQMAEISAFNEAMVTEVTGWTTLKSASAQPAIGGRADKYVNPTRPARAADQSFWGVGVSSMSVYSMLPPDDPNRDLNVGGSGGAWWWHSEHETFDKMDAEVLAQDTRLYAAQTMRLATADVLPFDLTQIAQDYHDALREYDEAAGHALPIRKLMDEVDTLKSRMAALHQRCNGLTDPTQTASVNRTLLKVARILNPVLYQEGTPFAHDPALSSRCLPSLAPALKLKALDPRSDAHKFAVAGLKRRLNQVGASVLDATRLIEGFTAALH